MTDDPEVMPAPKHLERHGRFSTFRVVESPKSKFRFFGTLLIFVSAATIAASHGSLEWLGISVLTIMLGTTMLTVSTVVVTDPDDEARRISQPFEDAVREVYETPTTTTTTTTTPPPPQPASPADDVWKLVVGSTGSLAEAHTVARRRSDVAFKSSMAFVLIGVAVLVAGAMWAIGRPAQRIEGGLVSAFGVALNVVGLLLFRVYNLAHQQFEAAVRHMEFMHRLMIAISLMDGARDPQVAERHRALIIESLLSQRDSRAGPPPAKTRRTKETSTDSKT